jgi:hypothetical protein
MDLDDADVVSERFRADARQPTKQLIEMDRKSTHARTTPIRTFLLRIDRLSTVLPYDLW